MVCREVGGGLGVGFGHDMQTFEWTEQYATDLSTVDTQHQHLVDLINGLGRSLSDNEVDQLQLEQLFGELAEYAKFHFDEEEKLMRATGIDERHIQKHEQAHRHFLRDVGALIEAGAGTADKSGSGVLDFLVHWLGYHILGQDQDMGQQIKAVRAGVSPEQAYAQNERQQDAAIEPLMGALNQLVQQLSARNRDLVELNRTLEDRVAQRTQALERANQELKALSLTDVLTGLPNRRHAMLLLDTLWQESDQTGKPVAALMIDADNFKTVNDTYGHDAGDTVLIELARVLKDSVRSDDLIFRLGGDEFLALCPATDHAGAIRVGASLQARVAEMRVATGDGFWDSSISAGVAVRTEAMPNFDALIKAADDGVYLAKKAGRNCVCSAQSPPD